MTSMRDLIAEIERAIDRADVVSAGELLDRADGIRPDDPEILFLRAIVAFKSGATDDAADTLERMIREGVDNTTVRAFLAKIREGQAGDEAGDEPAEPAQAPPPAGVAEEGPETPTNGGPLLESGPAAEEPSSPGDDAGDASTSPAGEPEEPE